VRTIDERSEEEPILPPAATPPTAPPDPPVDEAEHDESVSAEPDGEPEEQPRKRHRKRYAVASGILVVFIAAFIAINVIHLPLYQFAPGSARRTQDLVTVDGHPTYTSDAGSISYTTVSLGQATVFNWLTSHLDKSVDLVDESQVLGGKDADENRQENLQMMDDSKEYATVAALRKLGYDVQEKGSGAVIADITKDAPALQSDNPLQKGDAVVEVDGTPIATRTDLTNALKDKHPGDIVQLTVEPDRSGRRVERTATLGARPGDATKPFLGVALVTRDQSFALPFKVSIDSGQVGGPSAGLAFTLGIIDDLTPGSLTGGTKVAVTGTIDPEGNVGPVGGVKQKTFAVKAAGATVFLVPHDEVAEAKQWAGSDLKIVEVNTLDDALKALADNGGNTANVNEKAAASDPAGTLVPAGN
jgi:PDZ domain-containing protein